MTLLLSVLAFIAGLGMGYAIRPQVERRRRIRLAIAQLRARQGSGLATTRDAGAELPEIPRDYYTAAASERGSLAEGFGLKSLSGTHAHAEPDLASAPVPRDYYERETPDDEGILSEGYGLRRRSAPPGDAA